MNIPFTHLHVHSEFSLLDGSSKIKELVSRTKELGMDSIAITDHGVMYGVVDFYKEATANGIKPIIGCEVYVAVNSRFDKDSQSGAYYHLVLLAENNIGYQNLIKLVSLGFTEGFYYKPRIDIEILQKYHEGLIALSACLSGPVAKNLLNSTYQAAKEQALLYNEIMGEGNFFLELQNHGLSEQKTVNPKIKRISEETGIPLVCTNDIHYIYEADAQAHDILICIQTNTTVNDPDRMTYEGGQFYLKSPLQMRTAFPGDEVAMRNTHKIAERCNVSFAFNEYKLPKYKLPKGADAYETFVELVNKGISEKYSVITDEVRKRVDYEISVIHSMGFVDYFLVTWDFIRFAKDNGIIVGPGRGSAAGSIVSYALGITGIDPIEYGLIFERFLNPERISMPDIDIDFCYERRQEVIDYVVNKYGSDKVAQIITFNCMKAKGSIRDVGRALGMSYNDVDRIAKMVPFALNMTIDLALESSSELREAYEDEPEVTRLIDMSKRLEGLPRNASTHAAGVVICNETVSNYVPLNVNDGVITTQFPMTTLEELGLLKMDFLGLRTLTVIQSAVYEAERNYGVNIDIDNIDMCNKAVFDLICTGKTEGIFQLEASGMTSFMRDLQPGSVEDLTAGISLYRPGPMDFIPKYIRGKNNPAFVKYTHPALEPILNKTYGCIVYQEQVMQIVRDLAGFSMARSDLVRKAMSKKKGDVMEQERQIFIYGQGDIPGCVKNGIPLEAANRIWDEMSDFAKYAFNKSHAAAYAVVGYQTGWLKVHYPIEFMAALMTSVMDSDRKIAEYIQECKKIKIPVSPPNINESMGRFSVSGGKILFGMNAIKNVGRPTVAAIVAERERNGAFVSLGDFINRMENGDVNKRCLESLIFAGAFDCLGGKRSQYINSYQIIMNGITRSRKTNLSGQLSLFEMQDDPAELIWKDELPDMPEFEKSELLEREKEVLGFYVSGHPLESFVDYMSRVVSANSLSFRERDDDSEEAVSTLAEADLYDGQKVTVGGIINSVSIKYTKNGNKPMAFVTVEDLYGQLEIIVFPAVYDRYSAQIMKNKAVLVDGRVSVREDEAPKLVADSIRFIDSETMRKSSKQSTLPKKPEPKSSNSVVKLWVRIPAGSEISDDKILTCLTLHPGNHPVIVYKEDTKERINLDKAFNADVKDETLIRTLRDMVGDTSVVIK